MLQRQRRQIPLFSDPLPFTGQRGDHCIRRLVVANVPGARYKPDPVQTGQSFMQLLRQLLPYVLGNIFQGAIAIQIPMPVARLLYENGVSVVR